MSDTSASPTIGDNKPPVDYDALSERLTETHRDLMKRTTALAEAFQRVPQEATDEETVERMADFVKQCQAHVKNCDKARVAEKEPYLEGGRRVDGFFKNLSTQIDTIKGKVGARITAYQRKVAEEERKRREAEAKAAAEAAKQAAIEAANREAAMQKDEDIEGAIQAEAEAKRKAEQAAKAQREAEAKNAELSRARSAAGSVASLTTFWNFRNLDRAELDLNALREHLPQAALEQAVRSFIKAGGRKLAGVEIFEDAKSTVR